MLEEVSIFDNLNTVLHQLAEFFAQLLNVLHFIPTFIQDSGSQILRYIDIFPPFIWFLIAFAFGSGIITKFLHWGSDD